MTLMLVAALSAVAVPASERLTGAARRASNAAARDQALWNLQGAETLAGLIISRDHRAVPDLTTRSGLWAQAGVRFPTDAGMIEGAIADRSNCFNLNGLVAADEGRGERLIARPEALAELELLARAAGVPGGEAEALAGAAVDWADTDSSRFANGAEDFDYAVRDPPYRTANAPFTEVEEVRALAGVSEASFRRIRPLLCALPETAPSTLNVNTLREEDAPLLVALTLGLVDLDAARDVIAQRPADGWTDAESFWAVEPLASLAVDATVRTRIGVDTRWFELSARVSHAGAWAEGATLFERTGDVVRVVSRRIGGAE